MKEWHFLVYSQFFCLSWGELCQCKKNSVLVSIQAKLGSSTTEHGFWGTTHASHNNVLIRAARGHRQSLLFPADFGSILDYLRLNPGYLPPMHRHIVDVRLHDTVVTVHWNMRYAKTSVSTSCSLLLVAHSYQLLTLCTSLLPPLFSFLLPTTILTLPPLPGSTPSTAPGTTCPSSWPLSPTPRSWSSRKTGVSSWDFLCRF